MDGKLSWRARSWYFHRHCGW